MQTDDCARVREALRRATRDGELGEEPTLHAESCPDCAEVLNVARWLRRAARQAPPGGRRRPLPSASRLWWRAQIIRRLVERDRLADRATRPARWSQWAGLGLICLLLTFLAARLGYDLVSELDLEALSAAASGWRALAGLLVAGTVLPLAGFGVFWALSRDA